MKRTAIVLALVLSGCSGGADPAHDTPTITVTAPALTPSPEPVGCLDRDKSLTDVHIFGEALRQVTFWLVIGEPAKVRRDLRTAAAAARTALADLPSVLAQSRGAWETMVNALDTTPVAGGAAASSELTDLFGEVTRVFSNELKQHPEVTAC
jgi:hypothetical protein